MISAILFINLKGEVVISRFYRDNVSRTAVDAFRSRVIQAKKFGAPVMLLDKTSFLYVRYGDMFVVACTRHNANPTLALQFMYKLIDLFKAYFGGTFDENAIRQQFVLIYELLDETMDHGYPQVTAATILSTYIKYGVLKTPVKEEEAMRDPNVITAEITGQLDGGDWRLPNKYAYKKNEVFIDVLESINLLVSTQGNILRADVSGKIMMKTYLTGMPDCKLGLNDKLVMEKENKAKERDKPGATVARPGTGIAIDDVVFHRCVRLNQFDTDRTISFIPPDGEFELMRYRITQNVNIPFKVTPVVTEHGRSRVEYEVQVKGQFSSKLFATNVVIKIPTPPNVAKTNIKVPTGKAKFNLSQNAIVWKIPKFAGDGNFTIQGEAVMIASLSEKQWARPPITMEFQVPMFTASGLHVRFLKVVEKSHYDTIKWVRYMTRAGQFQVRV